MKARELKRSISMQNNSYYTDIINSYCQHCFFSLFVIYGQMISDLPTGVGPPAARIKNKNNYHQNTQNKYNYVQHPVQNQCIPTNKTKTCKFQKIFILQRFFFTKQPVSYQKCKFIFPRTQFTKLLEGHQSIDTAQVV